MSHFGKDWYQACIDSEAEVRRLRDECETLRTEAILATADRDLIADAARARIAKLEAVAEAARIGGEGCLACGGDTGLERCSAGRLDDALDALEEKP